MITTATGKNQHNTVTLYDGGIGPLAFLLAGIPGFFGSIFDYLWNYLVLYFILKRLKSDTKNEAGGLYPLIRFFSRKRLLIYTLIITVLGLIIDLVYYDIAWGDWFFGGKGNPFLNVQPLFDTMYSSVFLQMLSILAPMAAIGVVNFIVARLYLRLHAKQGSILGLVMGVCTAPWLILIFILVARFN
jgi:hypothetical protein